MLVDLEHDEIGTGGHWGALNIPAHANDHASPDLIPAIPLLSSSQKRLFCSVPEQQFGPPAHHSTLE
jgi:hypothetical protein